MNEPTPQQWEQIEAELYAGRKIQAIKLLREATGCDLVNAKQTVEDHEAALRERDPEKFKTSGGGCGSTALLLTGAALAIAALSM